MRRRPREPHSPLPTASPAGVPSGREFTVTVVTEQETCVKENATSVVFSTATRPGRTRGAPTVAVLFNQNGWSEYETPFVSVLLFSRRRLNTNLLSNEGGVMRIATTRFRLMSAAVVIVALATSAHGFSRQAVDDARALARLTIAQYNAGTATKADVALAAYNVLAMEYQAGLLKRREYCHSAQADLQTVAAAFDAAHYRQPGVAAPSSQEQQASLRQAWQDDVAGMGGSESKCAAAIAMTERLVFGAIDVGNPSDAVKTAKAEVDMVENKAAGGTATGVEVAQARLDLLEAQYRAKKISRKDYCASGLKIATELQKLTSNSEESGQQAEELTLAEVIAAKRYIFRLPALCRAG